MADNPLSAAVLADIARQVGLRVRTQVGFAPEVGDTATVGESFPVFMLAPDRMAEDEQPFAAQVRDIDQWHHQIYRDEDAVSFARSKPLTENPQSKHEVVEAPVAPLPKEVHATIKWIDANLPGATDAKLVSAPAYHLVALWVKVGASDTIVISTMASVVGNLQINTAYAADDFVRLLRLNPTVSGLQSPKNGQLPK